MLGTNELLNGGKEEHMEIDGIQTDLDTDQVLKWDGPNHTIWESMQVLKILLKSGKNKS